MSGVGGSVFFNDSPYDIYLADSHKEDIPDALAFLTAKLELAPGKILFDQCCGLGSLAVPLARNGVQVYGCDIAVAMIEEARASAARDIISQQNAHFVVADAFHYTCPEPADAACNWYTSFGYGDDQSNQQMLAQAYASLKSGGRFALDYPNTAVVLGKFRKSMVKRIPHPKGELLVTRESRVDPRSGRLMQTWTFIEADGTRSAFEGSVRIYLPRDLCAMLEEVGFGDLELYGNTEGDLLSLETNRCIIVGRK